MSGNTKQKMYGLRMSDFDMHLNIKPSTVLDLFQDVACMHADELGVGFDDLYKKCMLWVLTKIKFTIHKMPELYENVIVKTVIIHNDKVEFVRDFVVLDKNGETLISASSKWAVIDSVKRRMIINPEIYPEDFEYYPSRLYDENIKRIAFSDSEKLKKTIESQFTDLDRNGHVNNIRYADYAINALDFKENIKSFQIDFRREVLLGDKITFETKVDNNEYFIAGKREDTVLFCCHIVKGE